MRLRGVFHFVRRRYQWLIRGLGVFIALLLPCFAWLHSPTAVDPLWLRLSMSGVILGVVGLSLVWKKVFAHILVTGSLVYLLMAAWLLGLSFANDLAQEYTSSYLVILFASLLCLPNWRWLVAAVGLHGVTVLVGSFAWVTASSDRATFIAIVFAAFLVGTIALVTRWVQDGSILNREKKLRRQNATLVKLAKHDSLYAGNFQAAMQLVTQEVALALNADRVGIWRLDAKAQNLVCLDIYFRKADQHQAGAILNASQNPIYFQRIETERFIHLHDASRHALTAGFKLPYLEGYVERNVVDVPLRISGRLHGVLSAERDGLTRQWTLEDQQFLASVGDLVATFFESAERQKAEERLASSIALFKAVFESTGVGILVTRTNRTVIDCNNTYLNMFKLDREFALHGGADEVIAYCRSQLVDASAVAASMQYLLQNPAENHTENLIFKDGRIVERFTEVLQVDLGPELSVGEAAGRSAAVIGRVWFYRDVTERVRAEAAIVESNQELRQRNHELDSFVYRASHDLKAPLNSLMGLIEILKSESKDVQLVHYLQLMDKSVVKLDTFIRNLTDFSKIARLEMRHQPVNFEELFHEVDEGLRYMHHAERVERVVEVMPGPPFVGDSFHISIVLGNLVSNAVKYQDLKKPNAWVRVRVETTAAECVISVEDNGVGIPKAHQGRIFELFYRASNQSFGSGLGLYITRNAVEKMKGVIDVVTEEGAGTRFLVRLPNGG
jgi:signal transduction histidine kinase